MHRHLRFAPLGLALLAAVGPALPAAAAEADPWTTLTDVRRSLIAAGPSQADFVQTFIPSGFPSGDEEHGRIALALPDCLRWDYAEPYPKSFLLCGAEAFYWNSADGTGRRYEIERESEPGLDLLLLGVEDLQRRYSAQAESVAAGAAGEGGGAASVVITLAPLAEMVELTDARLVVDAASSRLVEIAYTNREGDRSRFVLSGYGPLERDGLFSPPEGIVWQDD